MLSVKMLEEIEKYGNLFASRGNERFGIYSIENQIIKKKTKMGLIIGKGHYVDTKNIFMI